MKGKPIPNKTGGYWDHLTEMKQSYAALSNIRDGLEGSLKNPNLTSDVREYLQINLGKTDYYIKKIEYLFRSYGGIS